MQFGLAAVTILPIMNRERVQVFLGVITCIVVASISMFPKLQTQTLQIARTQPDIVVAVSGEVLQPGNYTLAWGTRVQDAIQAAGGFTPEADTNLVNLAQPLDAGEAIFIPQKTTQAGNLRISINSASALQLESLPRIGPKMAQRIIEGRPFNQIDDLLRVKGIGEKTFEQLRDLVTL